MAAYNKFDVFTEHILDGVYDLLGLDVVELALVNSPAPVATNQVLADLTEISGGGYFAGNTQKGEVRVGGLLTVDGLRVKFTASGGSMGPFRFPVLFNETPVSPADPLIAWWDHGSPLTLGDGETFTVKFSGGDPRGTIFTWS